MEALAAHLKRRNLKILEEELSLPRIPEVVNQQFTKTSMRIKKTKPVIKYVSETTFSPEEEQIHEQVKMSLQKPNYHAMHQNSRILELLKGQEVIKEKKLLPKIREKSISKAENPDSKASRHLSSRRKSKSVNSTKMNLDSIFQDRGEFIKNYFQEINGRLKH